MIIRTIVAWYAINQTLTPGQPRERLFAIAAVRLAEVGGDHAGDVISSHISGASAPPILTAARLDILHALAFDWGIDSDQAGRVIWLRTGWPDHH
jgi:hypothetical protein